MICVSYAERSGADCSLGRIRVLDENDPEEGGISGLVRLKKNRPLQPTTEVGGVGTQKEITCSGEQMFPPLSQTL